MAASVVTVEHFTDSRGENAREVRRIRFKLANKIHALEPLVKHHKLYVERHEHDGFGGSTRALVVVDLPFGSYERSAQQA